MAVVLRDGTHGRLLVRQRGASRRRPPHGRRTGGSASGTRRSRPTGRCWRSVTPRSTIHFWTFPVPASARRVGLRDHLQHQRQRPTSSTRSRFRRTAATWPPVAATTRRPDRLQSRRCSPSRSRSLLAGATSSHDVTAIAFSPSRKRGGRRRDRLRQRLHVHQLSRRARHRHNSP